MTYRTIGADILPPLLIVAAALNSVDERGKEDGEDEHEEEEHDQRGRRRLESVCKDQQALRHSV